MTMLCPAGIEDRKKSYEAETKNTQSYGEAGQNNRLRQNYAPQSGIKPPSPQQVSTLCSFDGQRLSVVYRRYTSYETSTSLFLLVLDKAFESNGGEKILCQE